MCFSRQVQTCRSNLVYLFLQHNAFKLWCCGPHVKRASQDYCGASMNVALLSGEDKQDATYQFCVLAVNGRWEWGTQCWEMFVLDRSNVKVSSYSKWRHKFLWQFPIVEVPSKSMTKRLVKKNRSVGSLLDIWVVGVECTDKMLIENFMSTVRTQQNWRKYSKSHLENFPTRALSNILRYVNEFWSLTESRWASFWTSFVPW
jgi:hypothetical protein